MMDTVVRVTVYATDKASADKAVAATFARMQKVADAASIFDEKAEAFRLNRDGYLDNPSADLIELTRLSLEYNRISNGCFDITVQPLLDIWSAGLWKEKSEVQQSRVAETMKLIGSDNIELSTSRISLPVKGMKLTFGAIAKGYAVQEALNTLKIEGIKHATITAGGEIGSLGTKPDGQPWTIALVNPDNAKQSLAAFQWLGEKSISTSGNYERYFSADKKTNHLINPKTGYSVPDCTSVTTIASTNTQTDALATALFAMGPEAGINLVKSLKDVECLIVDGNNKIITSPGIDKYLSQS
jgi:thiamine biosynthesis lipoprotein